MLIDIFYVVRNESGAYRYDSGPHQSYEYADEARKAHKWTYDKYEIAKQTIEVSLFQEDDSPENQ